MVINESGLCAAMKAAFRKKSTGYKVSSRNNGDGETEIILSAPGWVAIIAKKSAPRKVLALIVEHMGDLPKPGQAFQIQDQQAQSTIYEMAVPALPENTAAEVKRTTITYKGDRIYQCADNTVYMVSPKVEALLASTLLPLTMTEREWFCTKGMASTLFLSPEDTMQDETAALGHLEAFRWT